MGSLRAQVATRATLFRLRQSTLSGLPISRELSSHLLCSQLSLPTDLSIQSNNFLILVVSNLSLSLGLLATSSPGPHSAPQLTHRYNAEQSDNHSSTASEHCDFLMHSRTKPAFP
jgi:hypothetical protein